MGKFKVICGNCGSDKVTELSGKQQIDFSAGSFKFALGVQRKCSDCDNEDFVVFKTINV